MLIKSLAIAAAFAFGSAGAAYAQDIKTNPAQTKIKVQEPGTAKLQVQIKNDATTQLPSDLSPEAIRDGLTVDTIGNGNVTKVDGTIGDLRVKAIETPGTTNVKVQDPGQVKAQVKVKPPKN